MTFKLSSTDSTTLAHRPDRTRESLWTAPTPLRVSGSITVPGSKSLTNRYLILAALSDAPTSIHNVLLARDTELMIDALRALGVGIDLTQDPTTRNWTVCVTPAAQLHGAKLEVGLAGTLMRFLPPVAALASGTTVIDGDVQARKRPILPVVEALKQLGVDACASETGSLPLTIHHNGTVTGGEVELDASTSSQFVSGLLLAGARFAGGLTIRNTGPDVPSQPHLQMTLELLRKAGVRAYPVGTDNAELALDVSANAWRVEQGTISQPEVWVDGDLSNAGPFLAAAMLREGEVTINNWAHEVAQPGSAFADLFESMGAQVARHGSALTLRGPSTIAPLVADCHDIGELVPTLAAVCAFSEGTSELRNIGQLRGHETDRLYALTTELARIGIEASVRQDDLVIVGRGNQPLGADRVIFETYADHRMATFAALIGLRKNGTQVRNITTTAKTLPNFVELWQQICHTSEQEREQ